MAKNKASSLLSNTLETVHWIGFHRTEKSGFRCPFLRKGFELKSPARRAVLHWSALGVAEWSINGVRAEADFLMPGWSDFRHRVQALSYDVTSLLQTGTNRIAAVLGDGWFSGTLLFENERNHYGKEPSLIALLVIETEDGKTVRISTDGSWEARFGPLLESDIYHGETYDARKELCNWNVPASSRAGWRPVDVFPEFKGIIQAKVNKPVRITEELNPRRPRKHRDGFWVFDFGQNMVGLCRLRIEGRRGQKVVLKFGEMLNTDGSVYRENLRLARATDTYVCKGDGVEEWTPRFTFHGFRYVEVHGLETSPKSSMLRGLVFHTDMRPIGSFECSNEDINQLNRNIRWGMRGNFIDLPTDCPQRDERLGWTGDAQVFAGTAGFHYDVNDFFRKWMRDLVDGQSPDGAFPDVAPDVLTKMWKWTRGNAAWGDAGVICPWVVYQLYGDVKILEENYDSMVRWIAYQEKTSRSLRRPPTTYGDWLAIDAVTPQNAPVPSDLVGTAYFAYTTGLMVQVAEILGQNGDAARFRKLQAGVVKAFREEYVTPSGRVVGDCQTGYLLALAFDLLPEKLRPKAVERLVELIRVRDWHLSTGFVGTPLLCPVLSRFGRTDVAYKLLFQDSYPSWLYPIRNGATTMWERWNSFTKDKGFGPVEMNSFNHYAYGAIGEWMYQVVGGLRALKPGYREILIAPEPGEAIEWAKTSLETPQGLLSCEWEKKPRSLRVIFTVPEGCSANLRLPDGFEVKDGSAISLYGSGTHSVVASPARN